VGLAGAIGSNGQSGNSGAATNQNQAF
jgi:hypothetical protein